MRLTQENPVPGYRRMLDQAYVPYLLAAVLGCAALVEVAVHEAGQPLTRPLGAVLALAATVPIALVRAMPVVAAVLIAAVCLLSPLIGYPPTVAGLVALAIACYVLGRRGRVRTAGALIVPFVVYAAAPRAAIASGDRTPAIAMLAVTAIA
ncbi:hypothetical protein AB0F10_28810, partial [Actinoplanes sp. NPDC026623]